MKNYNGNNIKINAITSACVQLGSIIQGLVIPRVLLAAFGSDVNGLVSSISQFLNFFTIIEGGVIGVILASLYLPVTSKDYKKTGAVLSAAKQFLKKLALFFACYSVILGIVYPMINREFSWIYTFSLVLIIGITTFIQYYYIIIPQLVIRADNRVYVYNCICILFIIVNIFATIVCIKVTPEIHAVKLIAALVYLLQPIFLNLYVKKHYQIKKDEDADENVIKNRWNGLGASIANLVTTNTDVILLTLFSSLKTVSIYTVYYSIINSIRNLISSIGTGFQSLLGQQIAKKNDKLLDEYFRQYEFVTYNISGVVLSSCTCLIVPFVMIYTKGISDANYRQPVFAILICVAQYLICVREPYIQLTYSAGLFKETQNIAFGEAIINIVVSISLVFYYGIIGVAIGTVVSSIYRFIVTVFFLRTHIIKRSLRVTIKKFLIFFAVMVIDCVVGWNILPKEVNIYQWIVYGFIIFIVCTVLHIVVSFMFYNNEFMYVLVTLKNRKSSG